MIIFLYNAYGILILISFMVVWKTAIGSINSIKMNFKQNTTYTLKPKNVSKPIWHILNIGTILD